MSTLTATTKQSSPDTDTIQTPPKTQPPPQRLTRRQLHVRVSRRGCVLPRPPTPHLAPRRPPPPPPILLLLVLPRLAPASDRVVVTSREISRIGAVPHGALGQRALKVLACALQRRLLSIWPIRATRTMRLLLLWLWLARLVTRRCVSRCVWQQVRDQRAARHPGTLGEQVGTRRRCQLLEPYAPRSRDRGAGVVIEAGPASEPLVRRMRWERWGKWATWLAGREGRRRRREGGGRGRGGGKRGEEGGRGSRGGGEGEGGERREWGWREGLASEG